MRPQHGLCISTAHVHLQPSTVVLFACIVAFQQIALDAGSLSSASVGDIDIQNPAKLPRLSNPEYGRSASDPSLSFARCHANSMDMPVESLKLETLRHTAGPNLFKALHAVQSRHVRYSLLHIFRKSAHSLVLLPQGSGGMTVLRIV